MRVTKVFNDFFESEKSGGIALVICTVISIALANSAVQVPYTSFWHQQLGFLTVENWINDGLMAIFFLMVGLELKREVFIGELSSRSTGLLPVFAAIGGMLVPGGIYALFNYGTPTQHGFGIPMATDIAFAIGILSLLGKRVPLSLKVFLTALAVIDDLGAIVIIALFYSTNISWLYLGYVLAIFAFLLVLNRLKVRNLIVYIVGGVAMWYFMLHTGVHSTIAGILLSLVIPFGNGSEKALSHRVGNFLHRPVNFFILPVFALANTAIIFEPGWAPGLLKVSSVGIILGLVIGKPLGIFLTSYLTIKSKITSMPGSLKWSQMLGAGMLGGIGFTMSIFVSLLAFDDEFLITESKISILLGSLISGIIGYLFLNKVLKKGKSAKQSVKA